MLYRRTPLPCGYSPSELLMGRQIRAKIDTFMPSPAHILQRRQRVKQQETHKPETMEFKIGTPCYARKYSQNTEEEKWVPEVFVKVYGSRSFNVKIISNGKVWRRHLEQLRPRYTADSSQEENTSDSDELLSDLTNKPNNNSEADLDSDAIVQTPRRSNRRRQPRTVDDY